MYQQTLDINNKELPGVKKTNKKRNMEKAQGKKSRTA